MYGEEKNAYETFAIPKKAVDNNGAAAPYWDRPRHYYLTVSLTRPPLSL
jgi:hypothetical protein